jgi:hypothetical protein
MLRKPANSGEMDPGRSPTTQPAGTRPFCLRNARIRQAEFDGARPRHEFTLREIFRAREWMRAEKWLRVGALSLAATAIHLTFPAITAVGRAARPRAAPLAPPTASDRSSAGKPA